MIKYNQNLSLSDEYVLKKLTQFYNEDIPNGDITTQSTVNPNHKIIAKMLVVEDLVFAGSKIIPLCFGDTCKVKVQAKDGALLSEKNVIAIIEGPAHLILSKERVMLNLIQRLSGIATISKQYAELAKPYNIKILDTRKTTPGIRLFEKYAVAIGGAFNHRLNLSDGILIKDNHIIASGSVTQAIKHARKYNLNTPIEIEVDNIKQIDEALSIGVEGFLLDNMDVNNINKAVSLIRNSKDGKNIFIEASGGINLENITLYLHTGVDAISIGALTHQATSKDIRLEFI